MFRKGKLGKEGQESFVRKEDRNRGKRDGENSWRERV
jgi:hypothetical protein